MNISDTLLPSSCSHLIQRSLTLSDADTLLAFRRTIFSGLPDPDFVLPETDEIQWCESRLSGNGTCIGLFEPTGALVAYASMYCPLQFTPHCSIPATCLPQSAWPQVAIIDSCMVHPQYRGNGLQRSLIRARFKTAEQLERFLCISLTSPINDPSRHNLMSSGLSIHWVGETAPNCFRQVHMQDLSHAPQSYGPVEWVSARDVQQQIKLTSAGYKGFCERTGAITEIGFAVPSMENY